MFVEVIGHGGNVVAVTELFVGEAVRLPFATVRLLPADYTPPPEPEPELEPAAPAAAAPAPATGVVVRHEPDQGTPEPAAHVPSYAALEELINRAVERAVGARLNPETIRPPARSEPAPAEPEPPGAV